jgi:hypothetical protein
VAALAGILRVETVALLFNDFQPDAIRVTADTFLAFLVGAPAHALIAVLCRAFYARQDTVTPVLAAVGAVIVNTSLAVVLVGPVRAAGDGVRDRRRRRGSESLALIALLASSRGPAGAVERRLGGRAHARRDRARDTGGRGDPPLPRARAPGRPGVPGPGGLVRLATIIVVVSLVFGGMFIISALALRIGELRSIVAIMVEALRRPRTA